VPVIGVARAGWTEEQFVERARRSLEDHRILDEARFGRFASLDLRKIDVPRLVVHGTADRILPIEATGARTHEMVKDRDARGRGQPCATGVHRRRRAASIIVNSIEDGAS
jgi:pimeloyl-ACP methyl ester carboxylesterase